MPSSSEIHVGPSRKRDEWKSFLSADTWTLEDLHRLVESDEPGGAFFEIEVFVNGRYAAYEKARALQSALGHPPLPSEALDVVRRQAQWLSAASERFRRALGHQQRELELGLMRWMRRSSCLVAVLGAGATVDAGGPSWPQLVKQLLTLAVERGAEIFEMRPDPDNTPERMKAKRVLVGTRHLSPEEDVVARNILARITDGTADTEALMTGAQICSDLLGQHLFTDVTQILYRNVGAPGPIHRAIAALATPQLVPGRGQTRPGWDAIISYNFDDLMGEALDAAGVARVAVAMRGNVLAGDPNRLAREAGPDGPHLPIYHLHGYTPRRLFRITDSQFVFSTAQYATAYGQTQHPIVNLVLERWLARPVFHALYVGCSFLDPAMNNLLSDAATALPARYHYALLQWKGSRCFTQSTPAEIAAAAARYTPMGVRPIWFDRFEEIPDLIGRLA